MSDETSRQTTPPPISLDMNPAAGQGRQQLQVAVNEAEVRTLYVNYIVAQATPEEMVLNLAFHTHNSQQVRISDRIVMGYPTARRLADILNVTLRRYEEAFGPVAARPNPQSGTTPQE